MDSEIQVNGCFVWPLVINAATV